MPDPDRANLSPGTSAPRWYQSLYWRMAIALIALVALMLVAEGALFLWLSSGTAGAMPARDPGQMARLVASDLGAALEQDGTLDIEAYLREQYGHVFQTLLVLRRDGSVIANHDDIAAELLEAARIAGQRPFARRFGSRGFGGRGQTREPDASAQPRDELQGRRRLQPLRAETSPIVVNGEAVARVAVVPGAPPFGRIVRVVGPTMALVAGGVLVVGGSLIALMVFGPARRRLRQVQDATERLGSGDLRARAPEGGGDEVTAVARSFNRMADELTRRAQALEVSDTARRQLLADVSHELMTPLTAMRGYIETLGMAELHLDPATRERYMRIVTEETHRLEHIIGDLLDLARLEGGGTTMRRERVAIDMLFERVAERHERELTARRIELERRMEPDATYVIGDPDRLEQALQNLVANALRYTPDDGRISLTAHRAPEAIRIVVRDTGPGIPALQLPLIFDRFYKADASRKQAGGSGLGLSIVKAIIERHGGSITARNDGGALFEITLPKVSVEAPRPPRTASWRHADAAAQQFGDALRD
jgi:signal transduction histidine kinase